MLQCYRAFTFNLYGITTMVPLFLTLSVWYPLKGYTYLKKHAGLFKYARHFSGQQILRGEK